MKALNPGAQSTVVVVVATGKFLIRLMMGKTEVECSDQLGDHSATTTSLNMGGCYRGVDFGSICTAMPW